ncbi:MAG TPA: sigma-70 family RNA polymerase sigma factor [Polyangia bacterium]|nr:sigma-70 family RNA polymerase sigma factor [Polyangia bacterium]
MPPGEHSGPSASGAIALDPDESGAFAVAPLVPAIDRALHDKFEAGLDGQSRLRRDAEEIALIARCVAGDVEAFRPLVQRYQRLAFSVAFRMLGTRADAEDIVQQAFVDAFNALDRFRGEGRAHAFSTWLLRIAVNRSKDVLKSKRRTEEPLERDVHGGEAAFAYDPPTPEANAAHGERRAHLGAALLKLPTKYREVLILRDAEDLSYEEIRGVLRLPITTLKIRVVRGRAMLRDLVERTGVTS